MKGRIEKFLSNFFLVCYIIFSIYWCFISIFNDISNFLISFILIIVMFILVFKFVKNGKFKINNKKLIVFLVFIALLFRVLLLFLDYGTPYSDYATFYYNSVYVATLEGGLSSKYIACFPHLYGYMFVLGNFMKVFGSSYISVIGLNIILDMIGSIFMYLFSKNIDKGIGVYALILWLFNPFSIYFSVLCSPVIIFNLFLLITLYVLSLFLSKLNEKISVLYALLLGFVLCISNMFRPIMIILIIAIFIYLVYIGFSNNNVRKRNLIIYLIIIFSTYSIGNSIYFKLISDITGYSIDGNMSGFSLYVGSNKDASGQWSTLNSEVAEMYYNSSEFTPDYYHDNLGNLGIKRYANNGIKNNILLLIKKSFILATKVNIYNYDSFSSVNSNNFKYLDNFVLLFSSLFWYLIIISNVIFSVFFMKNYNYKKIIPYFLFIIGFSLVSIFLEVSPRYFYPIFPFVIFVSAISLYSIINFLKERKFRND